MPASFVCMQISQTGGGANTEQQQMLFLTVANQNALHFTGMFAAVLGSGAGGGSIRLARYATAGSQGTGSAFTPAPTDPVMFTAAKTTPFTGTFTGGTGTRTNLALAGIAQTGGQGGWIATKPDQEKILAPNGGANGNAQVSLITNGASQLIDWSVEFNE